MFARPIAIGFGAAIALLLLAAPASVLAADPLGDLTQPLTGLLVSESDAEQTDPISTLTEPVSTVTEPITSAVEPVLQPAVETVVEPVVGVVEPVVTEIEPVTETVLQPVTQSVVQPVAELVVQPVANAVLEPVTDAIDPVVDDVVSATEPLTPPLVDEPTVDPTAYEPPGAPEWQPPADPMPGDIPPSQQESLPAWPTDPGVPVDDATTTAATPARSTVADAGSVFTESADGPTSDARRPVLEGEPTIARPVSSTPALLPIRLPGSGSDAILGSFSLGLAIGLAMLLLFLMPPPFLVRRLHPAAAFWRPLCFVGPLERPG